jgi:5-methylcytosine-specific restriction endonuclease McrA
MLIRRTRLKPTGKDTGPNGATRIAIIMRDESCCVRCGVSLRVPLDYSIHHRIPRGRGGSNRLSNLILLCGSATTGCHSWIESHRGESYRQGWLVRTDEDPATVPVLYGGRGRVLLDNNGEWRKV